MNEQKVPLLTPAIARIVAKYYLMPSNPGRLEITAIEDGRAVVIPRAELEAKDSRIAELEKATCQGANPMNTPEQQAQVERWREEFEQWFVENAFDCARDPIGSKLCGDQWKAYLAGREAQRWEDADRIAEPAAIDKELRDKVCDPDPASPMFAGGQLRATTHGLASGLLRERDVLVRAVADMGRQARTDKADRDYVFAAQQRAERQRDDLRLEVLEWKNLCEGNDATIAQLQAQVRGLEARLAAGEPEVVAEVLIGKWHDRFEREVLLHRNLAVGTKLYAQPPAAQVPGDPVAWRSRHVNYVGWTLSEWELPIREGQEQQPLYLDQRCAAIPDSLHMRDVTHPKATNPEEAWMYATGWNACRAAMIEGEKK